MKLNHSTQQQTFKHPWYTYLDLKAPNPPTKEAVKKAKEQKKIKAKNKKTDTKKENFKNKNELKKTKNMNQIFASLKKLNLMSLINPALSKTKIDP